MKYGLELEFFVTDKADQIVPAFVATKNLDGNPVVGEIRTSVHDSITDAIFDLKKLLYLEERKLRKDGYAINFYPSVKVSNEFVRKLRTSKEYIASQNKELLVEKSIYNGPLSRMNPRNVYTASLQINISCNSEVSFNYTNDKGHPQCFKRDVSNVFDYYTIIRHLDKSFAAKMKAERRIPGLYALKDGRYGARVEYRSLPNNVDLDRVIEVISELK